MTWVLANQDPVGQTALDAVRVRLTRHVYGSSTLIDIGASLVEPNWTGATKPSGCRQIDRYTFSNLCGRGGTAYAWLMYPSAAALSKIMVSHNGHKESWDGDYLGNSGRTLENTQFWLGLGFHVLSLDMPTTQSPGRQPNPLSLTVGGSSTNFTDHNYSSLDSDGVSSLRPYLEPVARAVNQAVANLGYSVYMVGLSGGGWTTEFAAALDIRIRNRYSVFGSSPWEVSETGALDSTDYEQYVFNPGYVKGGLHAVRYALGADHGRRAIQIWGDGDPTFSSTGKHTALENHRTYVQTLLASSGTFDIHYDTSAAAHQYTDQTLAWIWSDIQAHP